MVNPRDKADALKTRDSRGEGGDECVDMRGEGSDVDGKWERSAKWFGSWLS